ncbi:hypothetical protein [Arthrobacter ipis]|uniref:hypothetical protein n=1 Tax=Arthrobacter ipis TaxID=2716202 RepID=UPI0016890E8D|nr:hypothetical protein [Arthrobacter ipis]
MTTITNSAPGFASNRRRRTIAALMVVEALSLAVFSALHLSGVIPGGTRPYNPEAAGIAEAVIGVVLTAGVVAAVSSRKYGRTAAQAAIGFAIAGFVVGLTFTIIGGQPVDVVYHATVLPLLILTLVLSVPKPKDLGVGRDRGPGATPPVRVYVAGRVRSSASAARGQILVMHPSILGGGKGRISALGAAAAFRWVTHKVATKRVMIVEPEYALLFIQRCGPHVHGKPALAAALS